MVSGSARANVRRGLDQIDGISIDKKCAFSLNCTFNLSSIRQVFPCSSDLGEVNSFPHRRLIQSLPTNIRIPYTLYPDVRAELFVWVSGGIGHRFTDRHDGGRF